MKKRVLIIATYIFLAVAPFAVSASTVSFVTSRDTIHVGDTVIVQAMLDTEGQTINVLEGELVFSNPQNFSVSEINITNSPLTLWPNKPSLDLTNSAISFVGGAPKGIKGSDITLFTVVIEPKKPGELIFQGKKVTQFLNDGKGTMQEVKVTPIQISSSANTGQLVVNEWTDVLTKDTKSPRKFSIDIGRDASVYDNRYFISFSASDDGSGINYYEVQEGTLPKVRTGSPYVLQNQNPKEKITVTAFDNAGNTYVTTLNVHHPLRNVLIGICLAVLILFFVRKYLQKK